MDWNNFTPNNSQIKYKKCNDINQWEIHKMTAQVIKE